jgi:hypothetical protein
MQQIRKRLTYANVMSTIAVFLVLCGATAVAASKLGKHTVGTKQLKANSVSAAKLKKGAVTEKKVRDDAITTAKIRDGAVTGAKVQAATLGTVPSAATFSGYSRRGIVRVPASPTVGNSSVLTLAASPEVPLVSTGPFTVYAKCFESPETTNGTVFVRTSEDGAILDAGNTELAGETTFLNRNTPEEVRDVAFESASANRGHYSGQERFAAMAPGGTVVHGNVQVAAKNGTPPEGNGVFGAGNVCLFAVEMTALNG